MYINIVNIFSTHNLNYTKLIIIALEITQIANYLIVFLAQIENKNNQISTQLISIFLAHSSKYIKSITIALKTTQIVNYSIVSLAQIKNKNNYINKYALLNIDNILFLNRHFD